MAHSESRVSFYLHHKLLRPSISIPVDYFVEINMYVECIHYLHYCIPIYLVCSCNYKIHEYSLPLRHLIRTKSNAARVYLVGCRRDTPTVIFSPMIQPYIYLIFFKSLCPTMASIMNKLVVKLAYIRAPWYFSNMHSAPFEPSRTNTV